MNERTNIQQPTNQPNKQTNKKKENNSKSRYVSDQISGEIVIKNVVQIRNVNSTIHDIRGDQKLNLSAPERIQNLFAHRFVKTTTQQIKSNQIIACTHSNALKNNAFSTRKRIWLRHLAVQKINPKSLDFLRSFALLARLCPTLLLLPRRPFLPVLRLKTRSIGDFVNPIQQQLAGFHFIHEDQRDAFLPHLRFLVLLLHKLQSTRFSLSTRMKSISFRIFLCSLHTWMSCVISGLIETSLVLSMLISSFFLCLLLTIMELFGISTS